MSFYIAAALLSKCGTPEKNQSHNCIRDSLLYDSADLHLKKQSQDGTLLENSLDSLATGGTVILFVPTESATDTS